MSARLFGMPWSSGTYSGGSAQVDLLDTPAIVHQNVQTRALAATLNFVAQYN